jgi:dTDP-glucose 4,6-dehydratase
MEFDYVFHFAALNQTHVGKKDYDSYYQINVIGTKNVINSLNFKNFVLMSTAKVYKQSRGKIYESSPLEPIAEYERSKLEAEKICKENIGDRKLVILRPVNIVGPGQANKAILPVFFNNFMNNKPIDVFAPPETILQFLYIDDVIRAFKLVMERNGIEGIFNLSSVDNIRLDILVENIAAITNFKSPVNFSNNTESFFSEIVSDRAESVLNWKAEIGIKEILRRYYNTFGE